LFQERRERKEMENINRGWFVLNAILKVLILIMSPSYKNVYLLPQNASISASKLSNFTKNGLRV
jgi:hypothetical protein